MGNFKKMNFHQAKAALAAGDYICYEVIHNTHHGALLTAVEYRECVENRSFIDYDGFGDQLDADGKMLGRTIPSAITELHESCAFVLWYNR